MILLLKTLPLFIVGTASLLLGLFALGRDYKKPQNIAFFGFTTSVAVWSVAIAIFLLGRDPDFLITVGKVYYAAPLILVYSLVILADTFPGGTRIHKLRASLLFIAMASILVPLIFVKDFLTTSVAYHSWGNEIVLGSLEYFIYSAYLLLAFVIGLSVMLRKSRHESGIYKKQATLLAVGTLISAILGVFFNLILPWLGNYQLIWVGPLATTLMVGAVSISMVRHRMFDIRYFVIRALAYGSTLLILSLLFLLPAISLLAKLLGLDLGAGTLAWLLVVAVALIAFYGYLRDWLNKATNRIFFRNDYDPEEFIAELNRTVVSNLDISSLLVSAAKVMELNFKAEFCLFILNKTPYSKERIIGPNNKMLVAKEVHDISIAVQQAGKRVVVIDYLHSGHIRLQQRLQENNIAAAAHLTSASMGVNEGLGYIILGPKKSGQQYNSQDMRTLETIIDGLIIAIQNALRFEEIQNFTVTLQEKIDVATSKLQKSNDKLKQMDETKDEFISMASHQLRTPLTSVKGYLSMVLEGDAGKLNEMQQKLLSQAYISSQRMVFLIADLLNVSRLRTGKFVIEPAPTNLAEVVQGEVDQLMETAEARNLKLEYDKPANFPTYMLDETKLRQVIMNFMDNAIYYTPSGGHITAKLKNGKETIEFTVTDNGMGVPKSEQHHLFNKFYRAGNARKARPDGTGLGLFMAKKVVIAQGGSILFKSQEGKGSTFGFTFSKARLVKPADATSTAAPVPILTPDAGSEAKATLTK